MSISLSSSLPDRSIHLGVHGHAARILVEAFEHICFEQEVVCLVGELLRQLKMHFVLLAVQNEFLRVCTLDVAQIASRCLHGRVAEILLDRPLATIVIALASATVTTSLLGLHSLVVKLLLEGKRLRVAFLPKTSVPVFINPIWEHNDHLRDVCNEVLLAFDNSDDVLFTTLTERENLFHGLILLFLFVELHLKLHEFAIGLINGIL